MEKRVIYHLWAFACSKFISSFGNNVYGFGISLYILTATGSAIGFAVNLICNTLPRAILAPFAGTFADRLSKKKMVLFSQGGAALIVTSLLTFTYIHNLNMYAIYTATTLLSLCSTFNSVTLTSAITQLFDQERIQKAMAFQQASISLSTIGGPILGGALFGLVSMKTFLFIYISSYVVSILLQSTMNFSLYRNQPHTKPSSLYTSLIEGLQYVRHNQTLFNLFLVSLLINFFAVALAIGLPYMAVERLDIQPEHFGIIEGTFACGMLLASVYFSVRKTSRNPLRLTKWGIIIASFLMALTTLPLVFSLSYLANVSYYIIIGLFYGISISLINTPLGVLLQNVIEEGVKGRVFGIMEMMAQGLSPLGMMTYGLALDKIGALWSIIPSSLFMIGFTLLLLNRKRIRTNPIEPSSATKA
ncbi:MFS transporter [Pontibacillus chungwhensis]|uniref:MFS transporter n=1 Tax=Pontibacillus chungwhensis TaxID=265426 RepID=UPI001E37563E|nr:MFS transporter [Pontibacillus chungwhensis]